MLLAIISLVVAALAGLAFYFQDALKSALGLSSASKNKSGSSASSSSASRSAKDGSAAGGSNAVGGGSVALTPESFVVFFNRLRPESRHWDILTALILMPELLDRSTQAVGQIAELRVKRAEQLAKLASEAKKVDADSRALQDMMNDDEGWGTAVEDDEEDVAAQEAARKAKLEEQRKQAEKQRLLRTQGQVLPKMEGLDEGVLGQQWVETTLTKLKAWPPAQLPPGTMDYLGKQVAPLDHLGFRRALCMTLGRLHATELNSDPQLVEAGVQKLVDETYFKGALEFRQRATMMLEAAMRISVVLQSFPFFATLIETAAAFKLGCDPAEEKKNLPWFNRMMARQYDTLPRLFVSEISLERMPTPDLKANDAAAQKPDAEDLALPKGTPLEAGVLYSLVIPVDRTHAEKFTKAKIAQCQAQKIPPQIALQGYRETWWFLVTWESSTGVVEKAPELDPKSFLHQLDEPTREAFVGEQGQNRIRTAFPMQVQNIAQKSGAVKIKFLAPPNPGKYTVKVVVKSQDFLGADTEATTAVEVVEKSKAS